jgi:hypothetical protein
MFPSIPGCKTQMVAEYLNPETGKWDELRQTSRTAMDFSDGRKYMDL